MFWIALAIWVLWWFTVLHAYASCACGPLNALMEMLR
jgi:hypothetical protein